MVSPRAVVEFSQVIETGELVAFILTRQTLRSAAHDIGRLRCRWTSSCNNSRRRESGKAPMPTGSRATGTIGCGRPCASPRPSSTPSRTRRWRDPCRQNCVAWRRTRWNVLARALSSVRGTLERAEHSASMTALVSLNPLNYGLVSGRLILAPFSIAGTQVAAWQVRAALDATEDMVGRLLAEAQQQRNASDGGGSVVRGTGPGSPSLVPPVGLSASEVSLWWSSLGGRREIVLREHPEWIGNLDGIPSRFATRQIGGSWTA